MLSKAVSTILFGGISTSLIKCTTPLIASKLAILMFESVLIVMLPSFTFDTTIYPFSVLIIVPSMISEENISPPTA